jgi:hypothetical protein
MDGISRKYMGEEYGKLKVERDRYLALLQEIATAKDHAEEKGGITTEYTLSVESIQRHVRQQLEKWEAKIDG